MTTTVNDALKRHRSMVTQLCSDKFAIEHVSAGEVHAILGISSESGELLDSLKRSIFYDLPLDRENCDEEFADAMFYIQVWCIERGITLLDLLLMNERKLRERYGTSWSQDSAVHRDVEAERRAMKDLEDAGTVLRPKYPEGDDE